MVQGEPQRVMIRKRVGNEPMCSRPAIQHSIEAAKNSERQRALIARQNGSWWIIIKAIHRIKRHWAEASSATCLHIPGAKEERAGCEAGIDRVPAIHNHHRIQTADPPVVIDARHPSDLMGFRFDCQRALVTWSYGDVVDGPGRASDEEKRGNSSHSKATVWLATQAQKVAPAVCGQPEQQRANQRHEILPIGWHRQDRRGDRRKQDRPKRDPVRMRSAAPV